MILIITRHGRTIENIEGIIQGHLDGTLSELGKEQAKKVALRLKNEKIDFIYSSDLARATDTAKEISKFHKNTPIKFVKDIRERYLGELQGKKGSDFGLKEGESIVKIMSHLKSLETLEELYERAKKFLDKVIHKHNKDNVLFVGHNGIDKALICVITGKNFNDIPNIENLHNTSINIYEIDEDRNHKVHLFNCKKHLA